MSTEVTFNLVDSGNQVSTRVWATTFDDISITADEACFDAVWDSASSLEENLTLICATCRRRAYTTVIVRNIRLEDEEEELEAYGICFSCETATDLYNQSESDESRTETEVEFDGLNNALLARLAQLDIQAPVIQFGEEEIDISGPEDSDSSSEL